MGHGHDHDHDHLPETGASPAYDLSIPDSELSPSDVSRRGFLRGAGLLGAGAAASVLATPSAAVAAGLPHSHGPVGGGSEKGGFAWLAGDHHIHTQYSSDAQYRVLDQARHGHAYGLDWLVITDHGSNAHAKIGVEKVNPDIRKTREEIKDLLTFRGLEWSIPAAELTLDIDLQDVPNWAQFVPVLKRVDVIVGTVTGPVADKDSFTAPDAKVVESFEVTAGAGSVSLSYSLGRLDKPFYLRVRGTDGNRSQPGLMGASVDPYGPKLDVVGDADPWVDLWFYTNPIWVLPK